MSNINGKKKAVVCIAAGKSQLIVIRKARELGFSVIAVDRDPGAPGFEFADRKIIASTYESAPILSELQQLNDDYEFAAVINRSAGPPVVTTAKLCSSLGLPGVTPGIASKVIDKGMLMEECRRADLPVPSGCVVPPDCIIDPLSFEFPCVVRPSLSMVGKSGVEVVHDSTALVKAISQARQSSMIGRVNVEEYVPGSNVSLIGFVEDGTLRPLLLVDELNGLDENNRVKGIGMAVPSRFRGNIEETLILEAASDIVSSLGLGTTVCCMSFRCLPKGRPKLIEVHLDLGGDLILDELLPASTDFDFIAYFIRGLTGEIQVVPHIELRPTAVIFGEGKGLVSERPFHLLHGSDRIDLENSIVALQENIYA
jgi:biotin carboxylase